MSDYLAPHERCNCTRVEGVHGIGHPHIVERPAPEPLVFDPQVGHELLEAYDREPDDEDTPPERVAALVTVLADALAEIERLRAQDRSE